MKSQRGMIRIYFYKLATNLTRDALNWLKRGFQRKVSKMGRFRKALFYGVSRFKWIAIMYDRDKMMHFEIVIISDG